MENTAALTGGGVWYTFLYMRSAEKSKSWGEQFAKRVRKSPPIGGGAEKMVYPHPENDDEVVALFHKEGFKSPRFGTIPHPEMNQLERNRYKRQFYLIKILHALFPENIPDISLVATEPRMMIRDKVDFKKGKNGEQKTLSLKQKLGDKRKLVRALMQLGVPFDADRASNFVTTTTDGVSYLDTFFFEASHGKMVHRYRQDELLLADKLQESVKKNLEGDEQQTALHYIERFRALIPETDPDIAKQMAEYIQRKKQS